MTLGSESQVRERETDQQTKNQQDTESPKRKTQQLGKRLFRKKEKDKDTQIKTPEKTQ